MNKLTQYKPFSAFSLFDSELHNLFNQLSIMQRGFDEVGKKFGQFAPTGF